MKASRNLKTWEIEETENSKIERLKIEKLKDRKIAVENTKIIVKSKYWKLENRGIENVKNWINEKLWYKIQKMKIKKSGKWYKKIEELETTSLRRIYSLGYT